MGWLYTVGLFPAWYRRYRCPVGRQLELETCRCVARGGMLPSPTLGLCVLGPRLPVFGVTVRLQLSRDC